MSLEKILRRIEQDAQSEARKIIDDQKRKAEEIKENARKEASKTAEALLAEAEKQAQLEASRMVTQARLEKKINLLKRKKELIEQVLDQAFQAEIQGKKEFKKKIILKHGEREESFDQQRLKDELRPQVESYILEMLKL
ncbi:MAG: V-type ATP synthase subunit E family protein [Candidatus Aminicenantes bacterium]